MSNWKKLADWMYGDARGGRGFWYSHPLEEIKNLSEEQLLWVPDPNCMCMLWHVGHIAHRERIHIGGIIQGIQSGLIPPRYEVFGTEWRSPEQILQSIDSVSNVLEWVEDVREESLAYIESLTDEDFHRIAPGSTENLTIGHWLFITVAHGAIHIGRIQMLRAMLKGKHDRPC